MDGLHTFVIIYLNVLHGRIFLSLRMTPDYATLDKLYSTSYFVFWQKLVSVYHDTFLSHVVWTQKADVSNDAMIWTGVHYWMYIIKEFDAIYKNKEIYAYNRDIGWSCAKVMISNHWIWIEIHWLKKLKIMLERDSMNPTRIMVVKRTFATPFIAIRTLKINSHLRL